MLARLKKIKNKFLKKKTIPLKDKLYIEESKGYLYIKGHLSKPKYVVKQLWFVSRYNKDVITFNAEEYSNDFEFRLNLPDIQDFFKDEEQVYDLYIKVSVKKGDLTKKRQDVLRDKSQIYVDREGYISYEYPIRLGRFNHMETNQLDVFQVNEVPCAIYKTIKGNVSFRVNVEQKPIVKTQIDTLKSKKHNIHLKGKLYTKNSRIETIEAVLIGRDTSYQLKAPVQITLMKDIMKKRYALNRYIFDLNMDLNKLSQENESLTDEVYDLFFKVKYHDHEEYTQLRIGKPRFKARLNVKSSYGQKDDKVFAFNPYYTIKKFNLSFQVDTFEQDTYKYMKRLMRWAWFIRLLHNKDDVWLIGERPYKAQDTGFRFFEYMRKNQPAKNAYYVIEKNSPELKNVKDFGNILYFKSKKHIKHTLIAKRVISSHHPDYIYPLRTREFSSKVKAKKVFLQHGIMGTKNTIHFYGKESPSFETDLFIVSSDFERNMIIHDFGYKPHQVVVTGLSRFDSLFEHDIEQKKQLLIIPTWREWLYEKSKFLESEYFEKYSTLVHSEFLKNLSNKYNFEVVLCLHPNMQVYTPLFKDAPVRVISQGEVDVQVLMKQSAMMITDYSSVGFDFSFLNKPILYYQFDREKYIGKPGSHLKLDEELPGDIVFNLDELLQLVGEYAERDFEMSQLNYQKASKFIKYRDQNSSKRIFEAISQPIPNATLIEKINQTELYKVLFNRFRKSKYYVPTMKRYYRFARRFLSVDENLILFESGVGKQYADSPRNIYEEILRRNLNYRTVWVCNKNIRFDDPNTIRIKRLSPSYFYYLAKSKIWVNNQNFPTYIKKRPETTYLQTWHGTPLKKMLFDIENIMGRSSDYLERVSNAVKNWDYLISPSPYATNAFRSAFRYDGEIIESGYPRNDLFYIKNREELIARLRNRLGIPEEKKIILYAPTFRDNAKKKKNKFSFELNMDLERLQEALGDEYVLLLRMHVIVKNSIKITEELSEFVMDVSNYSDMQELLLITDILITDYSSTMFDFAHTKRPMLYYTYDLEEYRDNIRGFYMDFEEEAPGPFMYTTKEIIENVLRIDEVEEEYVEKYNAFHEKYCSGADGHATERIVDYLEQEDIL